MEEDVEIRCRELCRDLLKCAGNMTDIERAQRLTAWLAFGFRMSNQSIPVAEVNRGYRENKKRKFDTMEYGGTSQGSKSTQESPPQREEGEVEEGEGDNKDAEDAEVDTESVVVVA